MRQHQTRVSRRPIPITGACHSRESASALVLVVALSLVFGVLVIFVVQQGHVEAKTARFELRATEALYDAFAELESARFLIRDAGYDASGKNAMIQAALARADATIPGTSVVVERVPGDVTNTWYSLVARSPYEQHYERVVSQPVREFDYLSSYLLFVSEHPVGISGSPRGAIHTNRKVKFFFPNGDFDYPVTGVEGAEFLSGATPENTSLSERFNPDAEPVDLDAALATMQMTGISDIRARALDGFRFEDDTLDVAISCYMKGDEQRMVLETWTRASVAEQMQDIIVGYSDVNPHEVPVTKTTKVSAGFEDRTRTVQVLDHYETQVQVEKVPQYETRTRTVDVPRYKYVDTEVQYPVYQTATRIVLQSVWIPITNDSGGTTVGGDGTDASLGYWGFKEVEETYTTNVIDHYETRIEKKKVLDYYEQKTETYKEIVGYKDVSKKVEVPIYRTESETYQVEVFKDVTTTETVTVYDKEAIYESQLVRVKTPAKRLTNVDLPAPENGLVYVAGNVRSLQGSVGSRLTVAVEGAVRITGNIVYADENGQKAYQNGDKPWLPYEPNPDFEGVSALGVMARRDIILGREVPDNFELNASLASFTGRVGIEGVVLDAEGEITSENQIYDEYGDLLVGTTFRKNSIRRLGGVTTAQRPVDTVIRGGSISSGFNVGQAVFDDRLVANPPPSFLSIAKPRFFAMQIVR
jgi:hypothetical protein